MTLAGAGEDANATGDLDILVGMTLVGIGSHNTIIDANGLDRVFHVHNGVTAHINHLQITGGSASDGGGIYNQLGHVLLDSVLITDNESQSNGGGLYNFSDLSTLTDTQIISNAAFFQGGAIGNLNSHTILIDSDVLPNTAATSGVSHGGGLYSINSLVTSNNTEIFINNALQGGGLYNIGSGQAIQRHPLPYLGQMRVVIWRGSCSGRA